MQIANDYHRALAAEIASCDYHGLEATSFNLGNALLFAYRELSFAEPQPWLDAGIGWIAHCEYICRQFGVGQHSVWSLVVLIDLALLPSIGFAHVQGALDGLLKKYRDLPEMVADTLAATRRMGNRLEEAEVLRQMMQMELQQGRRRKAGGCASQAIALFMTLQRQDKVRQVRALLAGKKAV